MVIIKQIRFANKNHALFDYYKSGDYIDYITRDEATLNNSNFINLNTMELINNNQKQDLKQKMNNLDPKQKVWDYVVSFDKEFCLKNNITNVNDFANAIKPALQNLFNKNNIKMDDLQIFGCLHQNTDNLHMHIGFFEKQHKNISNGQKRYIKKCKLGGNNVVYFKEFGVDVEKFIEDDKYYKLLRESRSDLKNQFKTIDKSDNDYINAISYFAENNIKKFTYNNLDNQAKNIINNVVNKFIEKDKSLNEKYQQTKDILLNIYNHKNNRLNKYKLNNKELNDWYSLQDEEINLRNCNSILKEIKTDVINIRDDKNNIEQTVCDFINNDLNKNVAKKINKTKHISNKNNSKSTFNYLKNQKNIKPHSNKNAYLHDNSFLKKSNLLKFKRELDDYLNEAKRYALNIYYKMQEEIKKENNQQNNIER